MDPRFEKGRRNGERDSTAPPAVGDDGSCSWGPRPSARRLGSGSSSPVTNSQQGGVAAHLEDKGKRLPKRARTARTQPAPAPPPSPCSRPASMARATLERRGSEEKELAAARF